MTETPVIQVKDLSVGYDDRILLEKLNFSIRHGEIFGILGGSGCGKSTLLKHLIGLYRPHSGDIRLFGEELNGVSDDERLRLMQRFGVSYQSGALFGSMTVAENVALPLEEYTDLSRSEIADAVRRKLELVELGEFGGFMPAELSGGMIKRAGIARAMALDPELLFFDEPSAGLDPISAAELDRLILKLGKGLGNTIVIVSHELDSIFAVMDRVIILDKTVKGIIDSGDPRRLVSESPNPWVRRFLSRDDLRHQC